MPAAKPTALAAARRTGLLIVVWTEDVRFPRRRAAVAARVGWVSRPGGHVTVSFDGPRSLRWHVARPLVEVSSDIAQTCRSEGIAVWKGDGWEGEFCEGYHTTFHGLDYVREHWSQWFDV